MSSKSRLPLILGLGAAGGVGYYLYSAGGSPKAAENKFESDVHKASAEVKAKLPGSGPEKGKGFSDAGAKIDKAVQDADRKAGVAKSNAEAYYKDTKANAEAYAKKAEADARKGIDKFDKEVEDKAAKAKGGISSWFSSGNK